MSITTMAMLVSAVTATLAPAAPRDPIAVAHDATSVVTPRCRYAPSDDIVVCARRNADRYRLPIMVTTPDREVVQRRTLLARETPCQARGPFLVGCGSVGVRVGVAFGPGAGAGRLAYRPGLD